MGYGKLLTLAGVAAAGAVWFKRRQNADDDAGPAYTAERSRDPIHDPVDEAIDESFPASDPPSFAGNPRTSR